MNEDIDSKITEALALITERLLKLEQMVAAMERRLQAQELDPGVMADAEPE